MAQRQTLLLELAYAGASFHGVQSQPGFRTVASDLETLLTNVCGQEPRGLAFAARTDAYVNAAQNFATCWYYGHSLTPQHLQQLQTHDDGALRISSARFVPRSVNARSTTGDKHYQYRLYTGVPRSALLRGSTATTHWQIHPPLQLEPMQRAAALLTGTHDYSAFRAQRCDSKNPVKTIHAFTVNQTGNGFTFDVRGTAFLRHMVRILVGTLVEVGAGLRSVESVQLVRDAKRRELAGMTAPASGLWLMGVSFELPLRKD